MGKFIIDEHLDDKKNVPNFIRCDYKIMWENVHFLKRCAKKYVGMKRQDLLQNGSVKKEKENEKKIKEMWQMLGNYST